MSKKLFIKSLTYEYHLPTVMIEEGMSIHLTVVPEGECSCCKAENYFVYMTEDRIERNELVKVLRLLAVKVEKGGK
jgi:hypothetical protein